MEPEEPQEPPSTERSARRLLVDWANNQDGWIRLATAEVLRTSTTLPADSLEKLYSQYLAEKGLSDSPARDVAQIALGASDQEDSSVLRLTKLSAVEGVNALAPDQEIEFNEHLTVIFGENGAGKTGYTRVLKRASSARTSELILGNLHKQGNTTQSANISYAIDGRETTVTWSGEEGLPPLDRIDVFDSPSVTLHLDSDLTYSYTPADLALFKHVADAIRSVSDRVAADLQDRAQKSPAFLQLFERGTEVYPLVESLSAATDLEKIRALANVLDEESATLSNLRQDVEALKSDNIAAQAAVVRNRETANTQLLVLVDTISRFDAKAYAQALTDLAQAREQQAALIETISNKHGIPGTDDESWRLFVTTAERYREHLDLHDYPTASDVCLYCRQPLHEPQLEILAAFRDLVTNTTQSTISNATRMLATLSESITTLDLNELKTRLEGQRPEQGTDETVEAALRLVATAEPLQEQLTEKIPVNLESVKQAATALSDHVGQRIKASRELLKDLSAKAEARQGRLETARKALASLEARLRLKQNLDEIEDYVKTAKWLAQLKVVQGRLPSNLTSLTNVTKEAGELLLNNNFDEHFQDERDALRAPLVQLDFPGRQGTTRRVKTVASYRPSAVLSEGEQKAIALADFLAESSLRKASSPVIFDDPVNSLDYRRIEEVSSRVAKLAQARQVVVFTHNIWFATELLSRFEKEQAKCSYFTIEDDDQVKGLVTKGSHPRWDTVSKLTGRINAMLQAARAADGETREALVEKCYALIRSWIEVVVEQDILKKVVQRYQPNIMLTQLPSIDGAKLDGAKSVLYPLYEKVCRIIDSHSQPLETLAVRPKLAELEAEWVELQATRNAYIAN